MEKKKMAVQALLMITTPKLADKAAKLFQKEKFPLQYRFNAEGTAPSEIMDMLGLGSIDKCVLVSLLQKQQAEDILKKLRASLQMHAVNSGIAFTIPLNGVSNLILRLLSPNGQNDDKPTGKDGTAMAETKHALITAVVNRGFSGDVMNAARSAGAMGGTVVHSRQMGDLEATAMWGADEEKELVMILADAESRVAIMQAISEKCGMHSEAKGLVMSMPIDSVTGI